MELPVGKALAVKAVGELGYSFDFWEGRDDDGRELFLVLDGDMTLDATFSRKNYTVQLDRVAGGSVMVNPPVEPGKAYPAHSLFSLSAELV